VAGRILSAWPRLLHHTGPVQTLGLVAQVYSVETLDAAYPRRDKIEAPAERKDHARHTPMAV